LQGRSSLHAWFGLLVPWIYLGNVPIIEDRELQQPLITNTNPFEDVLQYAIRDLEFAAQWLPKTDDKGRVTRYSALSALARVYMSAACYAAATDFRHAGPKQPPIIIHWPEMQQKRFVKTPVSS
jgi:hypothetical protein